MLKKLLLVIMITALQGIASENVNAGIACENEKEMNECNLKCRGEYLDCLTNDIAQLKAMKGVKLQDFKKAKEDYDNKCEDDLGVCEKKCPKCNEKPIEQPVSDSGSVSSSGSNSE